MPNYNNRADLPISIAVFLATDNYVPNEDILSATQLIKPLRKLILEHRLRTNPPKGEPDDVERGFNAAIRRSAYAIRARSQQ